MPSRGTHTLPWNMSLPTQRPAPADQINPAVPENLSHLIMRLLAKDPAERPASAHELALELSNVATDLKSVEVSRAGSVSDGIQAGVQETLPSPPDFRSAATTSQRRRWPLVAAAMLLI